MNCPACDHVNADGARYCAKCGALLPVAHIDGSDPMIGTVVGGRYRITSLLGEGGMGRVYIGEQQMGTAVRKVAVKTLLQEFSKDPQVVARFMRECGTVVELEHPNTIKFYDFGQTDLGDLYIAMEYVKGSPLSEVIETGGAMSFDRVDNIMKQICGSLHEAHERGIVHRDLKPENVILTKRAGQDDFAKVLDFGIAKRDEATDSAKEQKLTQAGMVLGTPPYMSPEQFTGKELDCRSDIYSLGVMAYEMLTGQLPFKANTPWEWATQHMTQQPHPFEQTGPMAAQIPPHIKSACMRALSKDANERHDTAMEFYKDLHGDGAKAAAPPLAVSPTAPGGAPSTEAFSAPVAAAPAGARKGTGTQIGEPFQPPPGMGGPPVGGAVGASTGAMHQSVPTGSGQAIPAAPMHHQDRGGGGGKGVMIGVAVLLAAGMAAGAFFILKPGAETTSDPPLVDLDETSSEGKPAAEDGGSTEGDGGNEGAGGKSGGGGSSASGGGNDSKPAGTGGATPSNSSDTPTPTPTPPPNTPPPTGDPQACSKAISAAQAKSCGAAQGHLSKCTGSQRTMAQAHYNNNCATRPPPSNPPPVPPPTKRRRRGVFRKK